MSNLKRATPWMVTISFLLVCYIAAYYWLYKARYGYHGIGSGGPIDRIFWPATQWDANRTTKKRQRETRAFCQGNWWGLAAFRDVHDQLTVIEYFVSVKDDSLTITSANHDIVLVGKTWEIVSFDDQKMNPVNSANSHPMLQAYARPGSLTYPDSLILPVFPFYDKAIAPYIVSISGQNVHLHRFEQSHADRQEIRKLYFDP